MTFGLLEFAFTHERLNNVQILIGANTTMQATERPKEAKKRMVAFRSQRILHSFFFVHCFPN